MEKLYVVPVHGRLSRSGLAGTEVPPRTLVPVAALVNGSASPIVIRLSGGASVLVDHCPQLVTGDLAGVVAEERLTDPGGRSPDDRQATPSWSAQEAQ